MSQACLFRWLIWTARLVGCWAVLGFASYAIAGDDQALLDAFEREVRPILAKRCQGCHGSEKQKGGLRLDSRASILLGGGTGPALVPGKPDESLLIEAVKYGEELRMPPKSKLPDAEVATLTRWVESGAVWPAGQDGTASKKVAPFDLAQRAKHWSFQPIRAVSPPEAGDSDGRTFNGVDRFLWRELRSKGLTFAPEADRRTLIRRLTFDLTGLPPTLDEVDAFVRDLRPNAYERLVDRLLASPRYGERWGRHWLDVVRFAETSGHEFDYDIPFAWRYRDYVVRAFNKDVPYLDFVKEQVAGDLLPNPRRNPLDGSNESIQGTGFYLMVEGTHSPVDVREERVRRTDNQLDTLSKAFLGLTVSCARCHDHKFDPITQRDYYAIAGILDSSRHQYASIEPKAEVVTAPIAAEPPFEINVAKLAEALKKSQVEGSRSASRPSPSSTVFEAFDQPSFSDWGVTGPAFGTRPTRPGDATIEASRRVALPGGWARSDLVSKSASGVIRSRSFRIERPFIQVRALGQDGFINVVIEGFEKIRSPIYGGLTRRIDSPAEPVWVVLDVGMWKGLNAYLEIADGSVADFQGSNSAMVDGQGFVAVDEIRFADSPTSEGPEPGLFPVEHLKKPGESTETFVSRIAATLQRLAKPGTFSNFDQALFNWAAERRILSAELSQSAEARALLEALYHAKNAPAPRLVLALTDGTGLDAPLLIRGNSKMPGEVVPRRFLEVLGGPSQTPISSGSGRLELAERMTDPSSPLLARVLVNRVWKGHFGEGLVRSADDFGAMGDLPSHPELLDWLAARFTSEGGSIKRLHRLIVLSTAYRQSSHKSDAETESADPLNRLLHRANVRKLEAEAIRDSILAVSGRLDSRIAGAGVAPHLTEYMEGRGRPAHSGPLDGEGRRSLYLNVRRNFLSPLLLVFDFPPPATTIGRRNVSNVPAQALTLLNDPFVLAEARRWSDRERVGPGTSADRVEHAYRVAFGRPPTDREASASAAFLGELGAAQGEATAWAELCHALMNSKAFLFIE